MKQILVALTLAATLSAAAASAQAGVLDEVKRRFGSNDHLLGYGLAKADSVLQNLRGQDGGSASTQGTPLKTLSSKSLAGKYLSSRSARGTKLALRPQS